MARSHSGEKLFVSEVGLHKLYVADETIKGKLITDVETVVKLAYEKKCVVYRGGRTPAAFIANFMASYLYREIQSKMIYHYKKKK